MQYLLLIYSVTEVWESLSEEETRKLAVEHGTLIRELEESGEWVSGSALADPSRTRTVRVRGGSALNTDGPFAESKEHVAGYDIIDCDTVERAMQIAARIPDARLVGVEVRPLIDVSDLME